MKKFIFASAISLSIFTACNNADQAEKAKQDSIQAAATADSILDAAMQDTMNDDLVSDTLVQDSIR